MKTLTRVMKDNIQNNNPNIITYIMAGDGGLNNLENKIRFLENNKVSAIEIGIPFSDPVADGNVIQEAGLRALKENVSLEKVINELAKIESRIPLIIMTYMNPIFNLGVENFINKIKGTSIKGLIIPDLPYEHQDMIKPLLEETDIALIQLISLTSPKERIKEILSKEEEGFVYAVTINGTTGVRKDFGKNIMPHLNYLKDVSKIPVMAGFGISEIEHVEKFLEVCDGVIIGSKVVKMLHEGNEKELSNFLISASKIKNK